MKLGNITINTDLLLAPMMDITTPSFRQMIINESEGGMGMVYVPMLYLNQIDEAPKTILPQLDKVEKQRPAAVQIVGSGKNEEILKRALDILNCYDFDIIDINSGCPSKHTMHSGGGSTLIKEHMTFLKESEMDNCIKDDPSRSVFEKLIDLTLKYSDKPVCVKTRLGYTDNREIFTFGKMIQNYDIEFLTVHGRTTKQGYHGSADLELLKEIKQEFTIPIVGNGDIEDYQSYLNMKETSGCDAFMIGRGVQFDPFLFRKIQKQKKGEQVMKLNNEEKIKEIQRILQNNVDFIRTLSPFWNNDKFLMAETRRMAIWFIKGIPRYRNVRGKLSKINKFNDIKEIVFSDKFSEMFKYE